MVQILDSTRREAEACMAREFPAMARALIAIDIGGQLSRQRRFRSLLRSARVRKRILDGADEAAMRAEFRARFKAELAETHRAADLAWGEFLAGWRARQPREIAA